MKLSIHLLIVFIAFFVKPFFLQAATINSAHSGDWASPDTWEGSKLPSSDDEIFILSGHEIMLDGYTKVSSVRLFGKLQFVGENTTLEVAYDLNIQKDGELNTLKAFKAQRIFIGRTMVFSQKYCYVYNYLILNSLKILL